MTNPVGYIIDFTLVYNKHKKPVYNFILKMTGKRDAAEDILQTVFLKYYENMDKIKNPERAPQWIYTVARNEIYQHMRNKYKATITYIESEDENRSEADLESELERKEISQMVKDEIEQLSHDHKEVILLKEISGLSYKEIAQILNITEDLVKSRLFKARKKLSEKLLKTF
ncbi:MAG TPA: sigma-70 family RNA polymerase sigma factor [Ignavibacteriales bacterium]|nr:sigma-70 family RNA polymerase sigma factor [Ignavibacteriales bacterium]